MTSRLFVGSAGAVFAAGALLPGIAAAQVPAFDMHWQVGPDANQDGVADVADMHYDWNLYGEDVDGNPGPDTPVFGRHGLPGAGNWDGYRYAGAIGGELIEVSPGVFEPRWEMTWNCIFNDNVGGVATGGGSFVTANIVVTNNDIITTNFGLTMTLPTVLTGKSIFERGSITGTVTDNTFDDATVFSPAGGQIYTPQIDSVDETAGYLLPIGGGGGFSQSAGGPLLTATIGPQDFGVPDPVTAAATEITTSIGIRLSFDLTGGDSASLTSIFEVLIPAPGGLPVLAALGLLGGRRRRRH